MLEYWPQLVTGAFALIWLVRLEAKVLNNDTKSNAKIEAVETKVDNHIVTSKEKHDILFDKLDKVEQSTHNIEVTVAKIDEHIRDKK